MPCWRASREERASCLRAAVAEEARPLQNLDAQLLEQSLLTDEDFRPGEKNGVSEERPRRMRLPKNVGEYEGAWLASDEEASDEEASCSVDEDAEEEGRFAAWKGDGDSAFLDDADKESLELKPGDEEEECATLSHA